MIDKDIAADLALTLAKEKSLRVVGVDQVVHLEGDTGLEAIGILGNNWVVYIEIELGVEFEGFDNSVAVLVNQETGAARFMAKY